MRVVIVLLIFLSGCSLSREYNVSTHKKDIYFYSTEREESIGRALAKEVEKEYDLIRDPAYTERVYAVVSKLSSVSDRKEVRYYPFVIDDDTKNAFSLPGGYIYIFKGLMDELDGEGELAFVLAHEMAHIVARHHIKRLQAYWGVQLLLLASSRAESSPDFYAGLSGAISLILSGFSQEDELEADSLAVKYISEAGYDASCSISVLDKLWKIRKKDRSRMYSYIRSHPYIGLRVKAVKEALGIPLEFSDYINSLN